MSLIKSEKNKIRIDAKLRRSKVSQECEVLLLESLINNFLVHFPRNKNDIIAGYWPINSEVNILKLLNSLHLEGITLSLPVIIDKESPLIFRQWHPKETLTSGLYQILQPPSHCAIVTPTLIFIPLLAFDRQGHRLGYGAGYYDRTLSYLRKNTSLKAIGIAYAFQEFAAIPQESHDEKLDYIVTEKEIIRCRQ